MQRLFCDLGLCRPLLAGTARAASLAPDEDEILQIGIPFALRRPQEWAKGVRVPTLLYRVHDDTLTDPSDVRTMDDNMPINDKGLLRIRGGEPPLRRLPGVPAAPAADAGVVRRPHGLPALRPGVLRERAQRVSYASSSRSMPATTARWWDREYAFHSVGPPGPPCPRAARAICPSPQEKPGP